VRFDFWQRNKKLDLDEEVQSHLRMDANDRIERGDSVQNAQQAAHREFGNVALVEQVTRDQWGTRWLEELLQDLRYGARMLRKNPGFTLIAVLTLALGIGANTAIFSVVNSVLLNRLPYRDSDQLVTLHASKPNFETGSISYPNFRDWQKNNTTFSSMAVLRSFGFSLTGIGEAERVQAKLVSSDFFSVLGVAPVIGRTFAPGEDEIGAAPVVMISAGLWSRKFGSSATVLGTTLTLDDKDYTVVGVFPANFDLFLRNVALADVYVPIGQWGNPILPSRGAGLGIHGIGRLKPGVTIEQARADMRRVTEDLAAAYPDTDKGVGATMIPLRKEIVGQVQPILLLLLGAVGFVLLIACVNVANLMLARSAGRRREFAIRGALGAGHSRLVRQLLTESVLLAIAGGVIGLLLAGASTQSALRLLPSGLPRAQEVGVDTHVLLFTTIISLLAGISFGLAPVLKRSDFQLQDTLKEGGRGLSAARHGTHSVLVLMEMAMTVILLIGAGLMIRTLSRLWDVNPGFNAHDVLTFGVSLPPPLMKAPPAAIRSALRDVHATLGAVPGVDSLALSWGGLPMASEDDTLFWLSGEPKPASENDMKWALSYVVEPEYLKVMQIPLKRGRFFSADDNEHAPKVAVIDDVFARTYLPNVDPVGQRVHLSNFDGEQVEIVGVVGHVKQWGLDTDDSEQLRAQLYTPYMQLPDQPLGLSPYGTDIVLRTVGPSAGVFDAIRRANNQMSSQQVIFRPETMDDIISASLAARRFSLILLGTFATLALVLSSVGIYGVISYLVGQRTQEIGIRVALGARRWDILHLVLGHGAKMAALGVVIGLVASLLLTRLMGSMLYGVSPSDPATYITVAAILTLVALAASYIPARRATRIDPIVALRYE
jgi:predicted permease